MRSRLALGVVLAAFVAAACSGRAGCGGCGSSGVLATVERAQGLVEAETAGGAGGFARASRGAELRLGDALRTGADAHAQLTLTGGGALRVEPRSLVRFSATPGATVPLGIGVETGAAELEAPLEGELVFSTEFGAARVARGSRVRVTGGTEARLEVVVGTAVVDGDGGAITLVRGDRFLVVVGAAVLERRADAQARDLGRARPSSASGGLGARPLLEARGAGGASEVPAAGGASEVLRGDGTPTMVAARLHPELLHAAENAAIADLTLLAGETASIHDPSAPTVVRFRFAVACPTGGTLELALRGSSFTRVLRGAVAAGGTSATVTAPSGVHAYRVRCGTAAPFAAGTLRINRDAGTAPLVGAAPRTTVDADGRRYTVRYQTSLPIITLRWPRAPAAGGYVISLRRSGGVVQDVRAARAEQAFPAGRFTDGSYTFLFRTQDSRVRTALTSLRIDFDNAAPVADLDAPPVRAPLEGTVTIGGTAGVGALVSVGGRALATDDHGRFSGAASVRAGERCLAVRVAHRQRGVHYYLRCGVR